MTDTFRNSLLNYGLHNDYGELSDSSNSITILFILNNLKL